MNREARKSIKDCLLLWQICNNSYLQRFLKDAFGYSKCLAGDDDDDDAAATALMTMFIRYEYKIKKIKNEIQANNEQKKKNLKKYVCTQAKIIKNHIVRPIPKTYKIAKTIYKNIFFKKT